MVPPWCLFREALPTVQQPGMGILRDTEVEWASLFLEPTLRCPHHPSFLCQEDLPLLPSHGSQYYREFLGVVPGSLVQPAEAGEAARALCKQVPIRWVKKKDGKLMGAAVPRPPGGGVSAPFELQVKLNQPELPQCQSVMPILASVGSCWQQHLVSRGSLPDLGRAVRVGIWPPSLAQVVWLEQGHTCCSTAKLI